MSDLLLEPSPEQHRPTGQATATAGAGAFGWGGGVGLAVGSGLGSLGGCGFGFGAGLAEGTGDQCAAKTGNMGIRSTRGKLIRHARPPIHVPRRCTTDAVPSRQYDLAGRNQGNTHANRA